MVICGVAGRSPANAGAAPAPSISANAAALAILDAFIRSTSSKGADAALVRPNGGVADVGMPGNDCDWRTTRAEPTPSDSPAGFSNRKASEMRRNSPAGAPPAGQLITRMRPRSSGAAVHSQNAFQIARKSAARKQTRRAFRPAAFASESMALTPWSRRQSTARTRTDADAGASG